MIREVVRSEAAALDMLAIVDHACATLGVEAALALDERLDAAIESLGELASRGRVIPELRVRGITTFREIIAAPYRIIYRVEERQVWILAGLDHHRDLDTLRRERARRDHARNEDIVMRTA